MRFTKETFAKILEYSLVRPDASRDEVSEFCQLVRKYNFATACVNPVNVPQVVKELAGTDIKVSASIGFPFGSHTPEVKVFETKNAVNLGATEIDFVVNIGALKSGDDEVLHREMRGIVETAEGINTKAIIETFYLTEEEKIRVCKIALEEGVNYIKTSTGVITQYIPKTGHSPRGATVEDIKLIRRTVGNRMKVKAAGGIRTLDFALQLIEVGADRLGTSSAGAILEEVERRYGK